jgi:hypothetical protein
MGRKINTEGIKSINYNNQDYDTNEGLANCFAEHFQNIFADSPDKDYDQNWKDHIDHIIEHTDFNPDQNHNVTIDIMEIKRIIKNLKTKKSMCLDHIHNLLIKQLPDNIIFILILLFEKSINTGTIPDIWKQAVITLILKPDKDKSLMTSYRPISLLSCIGKILERIINKYLTEFLESNNIYMQEQTGFRKNNSTTDNLFKLNMDLLELNSVKQKPKTLLAIYLDIEKCFDRIWKNGLKYKILKLDLNKNIRIWLCDFLSNRKFALKINNHTSKMYPITAGVPQGAVLSPTLFNLYASDIPRDKILINNTKFSAYADDFSMNNQAPLKKHYLARINLQKSMDALTNWANHWRIKLNPTKCNTLQFTKRQSEDTREELYYMPITINKKDVPKVEEIRFLGLNYMNNTHWTNHIEKLITKINPILNGLKILKGNM